MKNLIAIILISVFLITCSKDIEIEKPTILLTDGYIKDTDTVELQLRSGADTVFNVNTLSTDNSQLKPSSEREYEAYGHSFIASIRMEQNGGVAGNTTNRNIIIKFKNGTSEFHTWNVNELEPDKTWTPTNSLLRSTHTAKKISWKKTKYYRPYYNELRDQDITTARVYLWEIYKDSILTGVQERFPKTYDTQEFKPY